MSQVFLPCVAGTLTFGPARDPYIHNVQLLLHGEGTNGSTTILDSSPSPKTVTVTGSTAISTAQKKFGGSSILGATSSYFTASIGSGGNMTGDFTWETWIRSGNNNCVFWSGTSNDAVFLYNGSFQKRVSGTSSNIASLSTNLNAQWYHMAISRTGSTLKTFLDGSQSDSVTYSSTIDLQTLECGYYKPNNNLAWTGYYDEMRVTKGVGRYTAAFTPPARRFPDS